jgi:hypothetical protein
MIEGQAMSALALQRPIRKQARAAPVSVNPLLATTWVCMVPRRRFGEVSRASLIQYVD